MGQGKQFKLEQGVNIQQKMQNVLVLRKQQRLGSKTQFALNMNELKIDLKIDLKKQKFKWAKGDNLNWYRMLTLNKICFEEAIGVRFKTHNLHTKNDWHRVLT